MTPEVEQELAYTLLVELLAYQFASPVRWIETQDAILADKLTERLVEIGPVETLGTMAKRTLASKYEAYDAAKSVQRQVLCYNKDMKEIYYNVEPDLDEIEVSVTAGKKDEVVTASVSPVAASGYLSAVPLPSLNADHISDISIEAIDIVHVLIAQKLKKPLSEIPIGKAIRDLVGGKSTLQNEIIGDLNKEFSCIPEKAEEIPLDELSAAIQPTFDGILGKQSQALVARLVSSKMPGGFTLTAARRYLETRWALASGRQDGVLLLALTMEPPSRLISEDDAKIFLDGVTQDYATKAGISLSSTTESEITAARGRGHIQMDTAAIEALTKDQRGLYKQQLELIAGYLKLDLRSGDKSLVDAETSRGVLQSQLDLWLVEHGEFYASGIKPLFDPLKARSYDSSWNWARQEALTMYYDIIFGRLKVVDRNTIGQCISIMNRSNATLLEFMQYHIDNCPVERGETYLLVKELAIKLAKKCEEVLNLQPIYKDVTHPTGPHTTIDAHGNLRYEEVPRPHCSKLEHYVQQMADSAKISEKELNHNYEAQKNLIHIYQLIKQQDKMLKTSTPEIENIHKDILYSLIIGDNLTFGNGSIHSNGIDNSPINEAERVPFLHLRERSKNGWNYSKKLTEFYFDCLEKAAKTGITFSDKCVLMTGVGAGSIGIEVLKGLLSGGAKVIITTSQFSLETTEHYQSIYTEYGSRESQLVVVPFNQGSSQDVSALIQYIYDPKSLDWDLDLVVPFAAISENGRQIDNLDSKSELAHRIMLTNVLRLLGCIKTEKSKHAFTTRPAQVILPLSPNHGTFGNDGLYGESKLALETLFSRWHAEEWGNYLTICGAIIGWTRGTGLMSANNITAMDIEDHNIRTFSSQEMAFNLLGLMSPAIADICQDKPVLADLAGGLQSIPGLKSVITKIRKDIEDTAETRKAVMEENSIQYRVTNGVDSETLYEQRIIKPRGNLNLEFPPLLDWHADIAPLSGGLNGMVDLEKIVVITGFAEIGPWGSSRTRWEIEAYGKFSLEGCIEMAWIMGLIKHYNGYIKETGQTYTGWVDSKSGVPVEDKDIKNKYERFILEHSGIRLIEPELFNGYNPSKKQLLHEIILQEDLEPFEASEETAAEFKREHGDNVDIFKIPESKEYVIRLKKGASLWIPKAIQFDRLVAGQIPSGWDAKRYGISDDIISQVDPVTLFVLVNTVEALLSAGITDPYEFYKYVHISEVGNCIGSGLGGASALRSIYKDRFLDKPLQNDLLQEAFINTMSAWVNMLLLSSSGPIKTPVGACATALESLDIGYETIMEGKASVCLVGGFDDFGEEGSYEFANMGATSNTVDEFAHGRTPKEMSRPTTTTRNGFVESQGCGIQVIMTAKLALEMGVPIYGILALTTTASDKIGRSVPAPGQGVLTTAREKAGIRPSPLLDLDYRRRQIHVRKTQINQWQEEEIKDLSDEVKAMKASDDLEAYIADRIQHIEKEADRQKKETIRSLSIDLWKDNSSIAPLRSALATWGLDINDLGVASFHGTSTKANDKNESSVIQQQLQHLGRKKGNAILGIFQKYLTGHPKGPAGAWMLNGALQVLNTGLVPGNRNADNVDNALQQFDLILYPNRSIQTDGIKAFSVASFGFGQKGTQAIGVHPKYLFATLDQSAYADYCTKIKARYKKANRFFHESMINNTLFTAKDKAPYTEEQLSSVLLNPDARASEDENTAQFAYPNNFLNIASEKKHIRKDILRQAEALVQSADTMSSIAVDIQESNFAIVKNKVFIESNFTTSEVEDCFKSLNSQNSFKIYLSAKKAVSKVLNIATLDTNRSLKDIEIKLTNNDVLKVSLSGDAAKAAHKVNAKEIKVSISKSEAQIVSIAIALY
ncbi:fatty acid synthase subunit alpha [Trichoderma chlorosporum]